MPDEDWLRENLAEDDPNPGPTPEQLLQRGHKRVFDPDAALSVAARLDAEDPSDANKGGALTWLQRMAADRFSGYRAPLMPGLDVAAKLAAIKNAAPNFGTLLDLVETHVRASAHTGTPFKAPALLLVGPPGVGKTRVTTEIARAIGSAFHEISVPNENGVNVFAGTDRVWRAPRIGAVARMLIEGQTTTPTILVDEIDKPRRIGADDDPLAPLLGLLEPQQARYHRDSLLDVEVDAADIFWLASANTIDAIAAPLLDRFTIVHVHAPTEAQMHAVVRSIYAGAAERWGAWFDADLADAVISRLSSVHPRAARKALDAACARAAAHQRRRLSLEDAEAALAIHDGTRTARRIGFWP